MPRVIPPRPYEYHWTHNHEEVRNAGYNNRDTIVRLVNGQYAAHLGDVHTWHGPVDSIGEAIACCEGRCTCYLRITRMRQGEAVKRLHDMVNTPRAHESTNDPLTRRFTETV